MLEPDNQSAPVPPPSPPQQDEGSMMLGYVIAWAGCGISLVVTAIGLGMFANAPRFSPLIALIAMLPMATYLALLVWGFRQGRRTGKGVLAMGLTAVGLIVLLVAACFGYFMLLN